MRPQIVQIIFKLVNCLSIVKKGALIVHICTMYLEQKVNAFSFANVRISILVTPLLYNTLKQLYIVCHLILRFIIY